MIRQAIPSWLFWLLLLGAIVLLGIGYSALSARQTAKNPEQTIVPDWNHFVEGLRPHHASLWAVVRIPNRLLLWSDLRATYWRLFLGLSLGVILSIIVGVAMGAYRWIEAPIESHHFVPIEDPAPA